MEKVRLGECATYINGYAFKPSDWKKEGIPIIRIQDLTGTINNPNFFQGEINKKYLINNGDILISWSGSLGIYQWNNGKAYLNQHIFKVDFDKKNIDKKYFIYLIKSKIADMLKNTHGSTMKHITKSNFDKIEINLHDINEQKKIANELDKVQEIIDIRKKQIDELDQLIKSQFVEVFENEKYPKKSLIDVCEELFAGGDVKKEHTSKERTDKYKYPIYTNGEKLDGLYGYTDIMRVDKEAITISGRGTIGFSCIRKEPFYPAVRLIVVVPNKNIIDTIFLRQFIENKNYGGQGASIPQLTVPMIKNELIPIPPIELQNQFAEFVKLINKQKFRIQKSLEEMQKLQECLMDRYFN